MWRSFLTASLGLGAVWIGLINLADAAAVPISRRVKQDAVQRLVSGLALSESNAQEAVQALNAHPDLLCDGNDNNTCTASTPSPNSNSYIAAEKAKSRAALACHIARLVFDGNGQYVDASFDRPYLNKTEVNWYARSVVTVHLLFSGIALLPARLTIDTAIDRSSTCWLSAQCFVTPSSASEVGLALEIVTFLHAKFAVRAGGHNPNPGFSSISDYGLLIDLSALNHLELSPDKKVVGVGPGNRWYDVYKYLDQSGVTAIGGRVPEVRDPCFRCRHNSQAGKADLHDYPGWSGWAYVGR